MSLSQGVVELMTTSILTGFNPGPHRGVHYGKCILCGGHRQTRCLQRRSVEGVSAVSGWNVPGHHVRVAFKRSSEL
jgi:hypothetical protein